MDSDTAFMRHWNEHHHAAATDDKAPGLSDVRFFRAVHEQDHANGDGLVVDHRHADGDPDGYVIPADEDDRQEIRDGLADCVSCETGSPSPCPTCGRTDPAEAS